MAKKIEKSQGVTLTENFLANLCERTFLKLWSYPNPYKSDSKEACDLIAVFENHVFLFFDRESRKFDNPEKDPLTQWDRWKKEVVAKQIKTSKGVKKYISNNGELYLDPKQKAPLPISIPKKNVFIHSIIVAHGASEACKNFSEENVNGSLGIIYDNMITGEMDFPFTVHLSKSDPVHIFDSHNLEIMLSELDTFYDFTAYITAKEEAINQYNALIYCGEEDLLAHYFSNFDESKDRHFIGTEDRSINAITIGQGGWETFTKSNTYKRKKEADKISYLWDRLLNITCNNALNGTLKGNGNVFISGQSAIPEIAKEPRFMRRELSKIIMRSVKDYPMDKGKLSKKITFMPSFYKDTAYVLLQVHNPNIVDYDKKHRQMRQGMLQIACGAAKNNFPQFSKIIGIAIDAPKYTNKNSEDIILLNCKEWSEDDRACYEKLNEDLNFFKSPNLKEERISVKEFPD